MDNEIREFWVHKGGTMIAETVRNPCSCCPDAYDLTTKMGYVEAKKKTFYFGVRSRKNLFSTMRYMGYEKLK
jgi:hypothetical protein